MAGTLIGLHGACIPQATLPVAVEVAARSGFGGFEPQAVCGFDAPPPERQRARQAASRLGIVMMALNEVEAFSHRLGRAPEALFQLADELDARSVTVVAAKGSRGTSFEEGVAGLRRLCTEARGHRLSLYFEMRPSADRAFNTVEASLRLAEGLGMKLAVDLFHFIAGGVSADVVARIAKELIGVVHVGDALTYGKPRGPSAERERVLPGEGDLPLVEFLDALRSTGYTGGVCVEGLPPRHATADPFEVGADAYRRTTALLAEAGWQLA